MDFWSVIYDLCKGFSKTLELFALTLLIAIPLGMLFTLFLRVRFRPIRWIMNLIIWVIRGTPLLLQCVIITFVPSFLLNIPNKDFAALLHLETVNSLQFIFVLVAFSLNYACYFAVIFDGGLKNVSKGQQEAGVVLGLSGRQIFSKIVLLQAVRKIVAPMSNEIITLVKDTALARALGIMEVIMVAYEKVNKYAILSPLLYAGVFYLVFSALLTLLFHLLEKKVAHYEIA